MAKEWPNADARSRLIDKKITVMLAVDDLPFRHVEGDGFVQLMKRVKIF